MKKTFLTISIIFLAFGNLFAGARTGFVSVKTVAPNNKQLEVWYRVPSGYDENSKTNYRVLLYFGGKNLTGQRQVGNNLGFNAFADENDIFIICASFKDDEYWEPKKWSGKALIEGIKLIAKEYKICTSKFLFYGFSAGGQCSNTFPAYMPEKTRAWVSHASGYYHKPNIKMINNPGLITCGDADGVRLIISKRFIEEYRKLGTNILWKSFPNEPHNVPQGSWRLAQAFLKYYHELYIDDLKSNITTPPNKTPKEILFVGDDLEGVIYPASSPEAKNILPDDKVYFISEEIAKAWQKSSEM